MNQITAHDAAIEMAERIATFDHVAGTVRLPDLHLKDGMEAPSSLVVASRTSIVPHLVSESINDGMGLIRVDVSADEVSPAQLEAILTTINRAGAPTKLSTTRYSWTTEILAAACRAGAEPLLEHYGLDPTFLDVIEDRGRSRPEPFTEAEFVRAVPRFLRNSRISRGEIGLNFGGNHFLELQAVDRIVDPTQASSFGVSEGQLGVMYHLGPGPLGSILSNLYAYRQKPQLHRKVGYAVFRNILHMSKGWDSHYTFARFRRWLAVDSNSPEGQSLATVLGVIKNYGFAYRMATVRAIGDALREVLGIRDDDFRLVVDISHNMLQPETIDGETFWVSRHNCCRPLEGFPGIVAGSHQVASCLTVGPEGCESRLGGYDHGVGYLLDRAGDEGRVTADPRGHRVVRLQMSRSQPEVHSREALPLLESTVLERAMDTLASSGFARPVAFLRPLATLKHKT